MTTCEKCWRDSEGDSELYHRLINSRDCNPQEQAGHGRTICPECKQDTCHQHTGQCMSPHCDYDPKEEA